MTPAKPTSPDTIAAYEKGRKVAELGLMNLLTPELRKEALVAMASERAKFLMAGDWEGVWQATGAYDVIKEAQG